MQKKELSQKRTGNNVNKKTTRKKEKRVNKRVVVLIFSLIIIAILITLLLTLDIFKVKNITVTGNTKYTVEEVVSVSGLRNDKNLFLQVFGKFKERIISMPYVKSVKVNIKFPNEIKIEVIERNPFYFAYDKEKNRFFRLDEEGYILEEQVIQNKFDTEILTYGISFDSEVVIGARINEIDLSKLVIYANIANEFASAGVSDKITKVNFENSLTTLTLNDKLNVILPNDTDIGYKVALFQQIKESISDDAVGVIDMTKTNPIYSTF